MIIVIMVMMVMVVMIIEYYLVSPPNIAVLVFLMFALNYLNLGTKY